jgi:hypothetical protein
MQIGFFFSLILNDDRLSLLRLIIIISYFHCANDYTIKIGSTRG